MTDDMARQLRERAADLREQANRLEQAASLIDGQQEPSHKRSGEQRRPPSAAKGTRGPRDPEKVRAAKQMAANDVPLTEIAKKLGVKYKTVWTWVRAA